MKLKRLVRLGMVLASGGACLSLTGCTPLAYPGYAVGPGQTGAYVMQLQWSLNFTQCGGPQQIAVDGVYGPQTQAAVERAQWGLDSRGGHLTVNGVADSSTWFMIVSTYCAQG